MPKPHFPLQLLSPTDYTVHTLYFLYKNCLGLDNSYLRKLQKETPLSDLHFLSPYSSILPPKHPYLTENLQVSERQLHIFPVQSSFLYFLLLYCNLCMHCGSCILFSLSGPHTYMPDSYFLLPQSPAHLCTGNNNEEGSPVYCQVFCKLPQVFHSILHLY